MNTPYRSTLVGLQMGNFHQSIFVYFLLKFLPCYNFQFESKKQIPLKLSTNSEVHHINKISYENPSRASIIVSTNPVPPYPASSSMCKVLLDQAQCNFQATSKVPDISHRP